MEIKFPDGLMKQLMSLINEINASFNSIAITYELKPIFRSFILVKFVETSLFYYLVKWATNTR
jgi:hypothetical protein